MALAFKPIASLAALALLSLGACATDGAYGGADVRAQGLISPPSASFDGGGYPGQGAGLPVPPPLIAPTPVLEAHDGLLSSPPNDARAGDCYAKVVVPGQPISAPPAQPRAVWVPTPPGPGQISPTWCIYYLPGAPQPVAYTPERFGWIRVICDKDATVEKIRHVQQRLHEWGDYQGPYDGHFDAVTAKSVVRFQEQRHIEHGGYLSVKTVEALDGAPPPPPPVQAPIYASPIYQQAAAQPYPPTYAQPVYQPPAYPVAYAPQQPAFAPPIYQPGPVIAQGCGQPACRPAPTPCNTCGAPGGYGQAGYGPYGPGGTPPYRALLSWSGKTTY